jgi:hypothetical protein
LCTAAAAAPRFDSGFPQLAEVRIPRSATSKARHQPGGHSLNELTYRANFHPSFSKNRKFDIWHVEPHLNP